MCSFVFVSARGTSLASGGLGLGCLGGLAGGSGGAAAGARWAAAETAHSKLSRVAIFFSHIRLLVVLAGSMYNALVSVLAGERLAGSVFSEISIASWALD